ncbi:protein-disulfide reductase DsbD domain-containing protein [Klebsiella pneumoniae]
MTASTIRLRRWLAGLALLLALPATSAVAQDFELPPVDEVFVLSAQATAPDRIEVRWRIADGYYLYSAPHLGQGRCRLHRRDHGAAEGQGLPRRILRRRRNLPQGIARHPHRHARGRARARPP